MLVGKSKRDKGAEHHEIALGEIDGFRRLVDQDETERDEAVYASIGQTADDQL